MSNINVKYWLTLRFSDTDSLLIGTQQHTHFTARTGPFLSDFRFFLAIPTFFFTFLNTHPPKIQISSPLSLYLLLIFHATFLFVFVQLYHSFNPITYLLVHRMEFDECAAKCRAHWTWQMTRSHCRSIHTDARPAGRVDGTLNKGAHKEIPLKFAFSKFRTRNYSLNLFGCFAAAPLVWLTSFFGILYAFFSR